MNYQELSSYPEFNQLHPVKQKIIAELFQQQDKLSPEALLPRLLTINNELSKRNLSFTQEETNLLLRIMKTNMTPQEQQKADIIMGLFNRY